MTTLKRCVIRDELVEDAKLIHQHYCLRNWGDAIHLVFATHRKIYLEGNLMPQFPGLGDRSDRHTTKPATLKRCVIRDELVEDAETIRERYCLRNWGDAINLVFAAHRKAYLEGSPISEPPAASAPSGNPNRRTTIAHSIDTDGSSHHEMDSAPAEDGNNLRGFIDTLDYVL